MAYSPYDIPGWPSQYDTWNQDMNLSGQLDQFFQQQMQWGMQQFQANSQLTDQVVGDLLQNYGQLSGLGGQLMSMYQKDFQPEYQSLVNDANNYSSQARIQQAMGAAESGVAQSFNGQRQAALSDLQSFGVDPSSGRYAELDTAERTQQAAAQAGAGFQAEQATEATGRGLRSEALQIGSAMPGQATAAYNAAGQSATAAENAQLANSQEGVNMFNSAAQIGNMAKVPYLPTTGGGGGGGGGSRSPSSSGGNQGQPSGIDSGYAPNSPGWDSAMQNNDTGGYSSGSGSMGALGNQGGYDLNPGDLSGNDNGFNDPSSGGDYSGGEGMAKGGEVPAHEGAIPMSMSPSGGQETDDVPARLNGTGEPIRLNGGEFVIPRDTLRWKGEEYFQKLIAQSRKARGGAQAKPSMKPALPAHAE